MKIYGLPIIATMCVYGNVLFHTCKNEFLIFLDLLHFISLKAIDQKSRMQ